MKKYKVVLWGFRTDYDYFRKLLEVEQLKGNIQIIAIIINEAKSFRSIDGIEVAGIEDLQYMQYDYVIDMNQKARDEVSQLIKLLQIPIEKIVPIRLLAQPFFDFVRWVQVKESKVSIISSHCWGGFVYNTLGLQFRSPLVNMFFHNEDFFRLLSDIEGYMKEELVLLGTEYETNLKRDYPIVGVGDVTIHFNHYTDFGEAVDIWNRRKERINYDNLLVEVTAKTEGDIARFLELPYEHKICYTMIPCREKDVISIQSPFMKRTYQDREWQYALGTVAKVFSECKQCDLLKLLNHEQDYLRAELCD